MHDLAAAVGIAFVLFYVGFGAFIVGIAVGPHCSYCRRHIALCDHERDDEEYAQLCELTRRMD